MVITVIIIFIGILLAYVLLTPIIIAINSAEDLYSIRVVGLARAEMSFAGESACTFTFSVLGFTKQITPWHGPAKKDATEPPAKRKKRKTRGIAWRRIRQVLESFRLRYLYVNLDTDNYVLNANLYPLTRFLSRGEQRWFRINFYGENTVKLLITNSLGRMIWAFIR